MQNANNFSVLRADALSAQPVKSEGETKDQSIIAPQVFTGRWRHTLLRGF